MYKFAPLIRVERLFNKGMKHTITDLELSRSVKIAYNFPTYWFVYYALKCIILITVVLAYWKHIGTGITDLMIGFANLITLLTFMPIFSFTWILFLLNPVCSKLTLEMNHRNIDIPGIKIKIFTKIVLVLLTTTLSWIVWLGGAGYTNGIKAIIQQQETDAVILNTAIINSIKYNMETEHKSLADAFTLTLKQTFHDRLNVSIIDRTGTIVYPPNKTPFLAEVRPEVTDHFKRMSIQGETNHVYDNSTETVWSVVPINDAYMLASANPIAEEASKLGNVFTKALLFFFIMGIPFSTLLAYLISKVIADPIIHAMKAMRQMANGKMSFQIGINSRDELGDLTLELNKLIRTLQGIIFSISSETKNLVIDSAQLSANSMSLLANTKAQSEAVEWISATLQQANSMNEVIATNAALQTQQALNADVSISNLKQQIEEISINAIEAAKKAKFTFDEASKGEHVLMESSERIHEIQQSTEEIKVAIEVIDEISEQINLLSLNASIEAARSGHHGAGFSVVAKEISKLSKKTKENANYIKNLVSQASHRVDDGLSSINRTTQSMTQMINGIKETTRLVAEISDKVIVQAKISDEVRSGFAVLLKMSALISVSTQDQVEGNKEFYKAISHIIEASNSIGISIIESAEMANSLKDMADTLNKEIKFFTTTEV